MKGGEPNAKDLGQGAGFCLAHDLFVFNLKRAQIAFLFSVNSNVYSGSEVNLLGEG